MCRSAWQVTNGRPRSAASRPSVTVRSTIAAMTSRFRRQAAATWRASAVACVVSAAARSTRSNTSTSRTRNVSRGISRSRSAGSVTSWSARANRPRCSQSASPNPTSIARRPSTNGKSARLASPARTASEPSCVAIGATTSRKPPVPEMRGDPPRDLESRIGRPRLQEERVLGGGRRHPPGPRDRVVAARLGDDRGRRDAVLGGEDRRDRRGLEDRPPPLRVLR